MQWRRGGGGIPVSGVALQAQLQLQLQLALQALLQAQSATKAQATAAISGKRNKSEI